MDLKTEFAMKENVRLKGGKYNNEIGMIVGMIIDENFNVKYQVELTIGYYSTLLERTSEKLSHVDSGCSRISLCKRCREPKHIAIDDICYDCIPGAIVDTKNYIWLLKNEIKSNERKLLNKTLSNIGLTSLFEETIRLMEEIRKAEDDLKRINTYSN